MMTEALFGSSSGGAIGSAHHCLNVDLLRYCESVVHLHPEIADGAFQPMASWP
jgi:hypothetical protein